MDGYGDFTGFTLALDQDSRHTGESRNDEFHDAYCDFAGFTVA